MFAVEPPAGLPRALGVLAYLGAVLAFLFVQELGLRLRDEEQRAWWAGTGRDLLNAAGLVSIAAALRALGLGWAGALLVGGSLTLAMFGASVFVATQLATQHRRLWAVVLGLALAVPLLVFLGPILAALARVVEALFPGAASPPPPPLG